MTPNVRMQGIFTAIALGALIAIAVLAGVALADGAARHGADPDGAGLVADAVGAVEARGAPMAR